MFIRKHASDPRARSLNKTNLSWQMRWLTIYFNISKAKLPYAHKREIRYGCNTIDIRKAYIG